MAIGTFVLHRFCGDEVYSLGECEMFAYEDDGLVLSFEARTANVLQSLPDTAELHATPKAEVSVRVPALDPLALVGSRFVVPSGHDEASEDWVGTLYYCEHEDLNENVLEVMSRFEDRFRVLWVGVTQDVNYYDGSKPPTRVEIDGFFRFKEMEKWTQASRGQA